MANSSRQDKKKNGHTIAQAKATKKNGHGFGLHSGAIAAKEMGGALLAHSSGIGAGATFTLELPALVEAVEDGTTTPAAAAQRLLGLL